MEALGYSSNLAPAERVDEVAAHLRDFAGPLRRILGWQQLGVDLRLGSIAIAELRAAPERIGSLRAALDAAGCTVPTINAFPLPPFQAERVKGNAYRPDWTSEERLNDSLALIPIAADVCAVDEPTISTVPGTFRPWLHSREQIRVIARQLGIWASAAARYARRHGRRVRLCLEPEPWCLLENSHDVAWFWRGPLAEEGVAAASAQLDGDTAAARAAIADHLGICFDTCHCSLAFEDQHAAVARIQAAGARVAKCQFSAAPEVQGDDPQALAALQALAEPRFLHQTALRSRNGSMVKACDLDEFAAARARLGEHLASVRSHFHVPVAEAPRHLPGLGTTLADSRAGLAACIAAGCQHIAVETYTWNLLADASDVLAGTAAEMRALQDYVAAC